MSTSSPSHRRMRLIVVVMGAVAAAMMVQLIRVQFGPYAPAFAAREAFTEDRADEVEPARGLIYDRDGRLLASNVPMYYLEVEVRQLTPQSAKQIAAVLSRTLVLPYEDLLAQLTRDWVAEGQVRIRLTREIRAGERWPLMVDQVVADMLNGFLADPLSPDLTGLSLVPGPLRAYPAGKTAGHVLGFVNQRGKGFFGVEGFYNDWLSGKPITIPRSSIPPEAQLEPEPPAGVNLVLTIDLDLQVIVESILEAAIEESEAESGQVVVMHPGSGELLALAIWPPLDPNNYEPWLPAEERLNWDWLLGGFNPAEAPTHAESTDEQEEEEAVIDPAVAGVYEPGSTFKVLTMAAALDAGVVTLDDEYIDTGLIEVGGHPIRNWDGGAWGPRSMRECMQHSLNVCLAYVASEKLGASLFYDYLKAFGIGKLTGVDLEGEVPGQLRTPRHPDWTESDLGTNSFGQGVSVTPIQLLAAVSAIANEGSMVQPHIVRAVVGPDGEYWPKTTILGRPISPETAQTLTAMLSETLDGETNFADVAGYDLAGKTGTAQIPTERGYDPNHTIASFVGWGPLDDPQFVVLVRIDKPRTSPWGSVVAAPVFREVVRRLVVLLEIPPDAIRAEIAAGDVAPSD